MIFSGLRLYAIIIDGYREEKSKPAIGLLFINSSSLSFMNFTASSSERGKFSAKIAFKSFADGDLPLFG